MIPEDWRKRLRDAVRRSGRKQSEIARAAGIAPETLSRVLTNEITRPSFDVVVRITHAAEESVGWLLREDDFPYSADERETLIAAAEIVLRREACIIVRP